MKNLNLKPRTKAAGLQELRRLGWILVDATYEQVDQIKKNSGRNKVILRDYGNLKDDLSALLPDRSTPVVLIKANVCRLLDKRLSEDGFNLSTEADPSTFRVMAGSMNSSANSAKCCIRGMVVKHPENASLKVGIDRTGRRVLAAVAERIGAAQIRGVHVATMPPWRLLGIFHAPSKSLLES